MNDIKSYLEVLADFNPIYYSIFLVLLVIFIVYIVNRHVVIPLHMEHLKKQDQLNRENKELMALFAELDPDPVLRVDLEGRIIHSNNIASTLLEPGKLIGQNITELIPQITEIQKQIEMNSSKSFNITLNNRDYAVVFRGIKNLKFAQIYFNEITDRKNYERVLKEFSTHLQCSIEEERNRIAKELHDGIGQNLSAARLKATRLECKLSNSEDSGEVREINDILSCSIKELKEISYNLKPRVLDEIGLEPALISLCNSFSKDSLIEGKFKFDRIDRKLSHTHETCLYRIAQEALANIQKHSGATEYSMHLMDKKDRLKLIVSDNGRGFNYEELVIKMGLKKSMGLLSMRERAESLGGKFQVESSPDEGTIIMAEIPVEEVKR